MPAKKSWHVDVEVRPDLLEGSYMLLRVNSNLDFQRVIACYERHKVPGYDIGAIELIYNPRMEDGFKARMSALNNQHEKPAFMPKWKEGSRTTEEFNFRGNIIKKCEELSEPYVDTEFPHVKLMPLWHGTQREKLTSIFETGYANLATTDAGFFGKGIYSANEAEYAFRVYSKEGTLDGTEGTLILNWVSMFSAYPCIRDDVIRIEGGANYENYDAHFVPVVPDNCQNPDEVNYSACTLGEKYKYIEVVVFQQSQCLPRYLVTLQPSLPKEPGRGSSPEPEMLYQEANGCLKSKNFTRAFELFTQASNKDHAKSKTSLGTFYAEPESTGNVVPKNTQRAKELFIEASAKGHTRARHNLEILRNLGA